MINIGVGYLIFSVSVLGMGLFSSIQDHLYFYSAICLMNLIAWYIALIYQDDEEV